MIVEYIRYELKEHRADELIDAYRAAGEHLRVSPECLGYDVAAAEDATPSVVVRILWSSSQAHTEGFRKGPNFPPFLGLVRPFLSEIAEMRHYIPTQIEWTR